jgi:hypothetical protein
MFGSSAAAATFWPEVSQPLTEADLASLAAEPGVKSSGDRLVIDDMVFSRAKLLTSGFTGKRWPSGKLIYDASLLKPTQLNAFLAACKLWEEAGVSCVARTKADKTGYLEIIPLKGTKVSSTYVGYPGKDGIATMSLCCFDSASHIAHELGHSFGASHEHMRSDRDTYVKIITANIKPDHLAQFVKRRTENYGDYDFDSEMHYRGDAFSKNKGITIEVLPPNQDKQDVIGKATQPSQLDISGMKERYESSSNHR